MIAIISFLNSNTDFSINDFELNKNQISSLYSYMEYDKSGDYEINENFHVEILKYGDRGEKVNEILGNEKSLLTQPKIVFELEFINPLYIENFDEMETDSYLDSFIVDWLNKE